jgi:CBS domain-containing protein
MESAPKPTDEKERIRELAKRVLRTEAEAVAALAGVALQIMESRKITSLLVVDPEGNLEGIVHLHDLWSTGMI